MRELPAPAAVALLAAAGAALLTLAAGATAAALLAPAATAAGAPVKRSLGRVQEISFLRSCHQYVLPARLPRSQIASVQPGGSGGVGSTRTRRTNSGYARLSLPAEST